MTQPPIPFDEDPTLDTDAERERADANRRASTRRAIDRRVAAVIEGMSDAFLALDAEWRVIYANREAARLNNTTPEALIGRNHWTQWPETAGGEVEALYRHAMREQVPVRLEHYYPQAARWHEIRAYPMDAGGLAIFYRDVTEHRHLAAERERQSRELAEAHDSAMATELQFRLMVD